MDSVSIQAEFSGDSFFLNKKCISTYQAILPKQNFWSNNKAGMSPCGMVWAKYQKKICFYKVK